MIINHIDITQFTQWVKIIFVLTPTVIDLFLELIVRKSASFICFGCGLNFGHFVLGNLWRGEIWEAKMTDLRWVRILIFPSGLNLVSLDLATWSQNHLQHQSIQLRFLFPPLNSCFAFPSFLGYNLRSPPIRIICLKHPLQVYYYI